MAESIFTDQGFIRPALLLAAYRSGLFPMSLDNSGEIGWFSPDPRGIIPLDGFHISRSLRRTLKKDPFEIRVDSDFPAVIRGCSDRRTTWISGTIRKSYEKLHELGYAHSVECWKGGRLAGGLYGVAIGGAFFGESMFSNEPDASKIALVHLVERLVGNGFILLDTQWSTLHLERFGCREIPRDEYLERLELSLAVETEF